MMKVLIVLGLIITVLLYPMLLYSTVEDVVCVVSDKERVISRDASKYLIFCENETFENTDSLVFMKFNSSDVYGSIKRDKHYKLTVAGWRIPVLSNYRNIVKVAK